jgi:hypothetical protein
VATSNGGLCQSSAAGACATSNPPRMLQWFENTGITWPRRPRPTKEAGRPGALLGVFKGLFAPAVANGWIKLSPAAQLTAAVEGGAQALHPAMIHRQLKKLRATNRFLRVRNLAEDLSLPSIPNDIAQWGSTKFIAAAAALSRRDGHDGCGFVPLVRRDIFLAAPCVCCAYVAMALMRFQRRATATTPSCSWLFHCVI